MLYQIFMSKEDGTDAPFSSMVFADGIVAAQLSASATLNEFQSEGTMLGWTIQTVLEG